MDHDPAAAGAGGAVDRRRSAHRVPGPALPPRGLELHRPFPGDPVDRSRHGEHAQRHAVSLGLEWGLVVAVGGGRGRRASGSPTASTWIDPELRARRRVWPSASRSLYKLLLNKYWVDEIYDATVIAGTVKLSRSPVGVRRAGGGWCGQRHRAVDRRVRRSCPGSSISGWWTARSIWWATCYDVASRRFRRLQVGFAQGYAMVMVFGAAMLLGIFLLRQTLGS